MDSPALNARSRRVSQDAQDMVCVKDRNALASHHMLALHVVFSSVPTSAPESVCVMPRMTTPANVRTNMQDRVANSRRSIATRGVRLCTRRDRIRDACVMMDTVLSRIVRTNLADSKDVTQVPVLTVYVSVLLGLVENIARKLVVVLLDATLDHV